MSTKLEKPASQVRSITELKKVLPKVKILTKARIITEPKSDNLNTEVNEAANPMEELKNYCRTCAGLKVPLVDIFSKKGLQMRLNQQLKHLENIEKHDSLSTQMCMDCICDLKMSYKFFLQIKKAQVKLQSIHASLSTSARPENRNNQMPSVKIVLPSPILSPQQPLYPGESVAGNMYDISDLENASSSPGFSLKSTVRCSETTAKSTERLTNSSPHVYALKSSQSAVAVLPNDTASLLAVLEDDVESADPIPADSDAFNPEQTLNATAEDIAEAAELVQDLEEDNIEAIDELDADHDYASMLGPEQSQEFAKATNFATAESTAEFIIKDEDFTSGMPTEFEIQNEIEAYVKLESQPDGSEIPSVRIAVKQPNILKRKSSTSVVTEEESVTKKQKLNTESVPANNEGIMYVTVKGSKPNEVLLVKVKKMDKAEKKDEKSMKKTRPIELTSFDQVLKGYTKEQTIDGGKNENREAIIEEQIEQYKKRREQILGGVTNLREAFNDAPVRYVSSYSAPVVTGTVEQPSIEMETVETVHEPAESLTRLALIKQKWEEVKVKKETIDREIETHRDGDLEKITRILGEKEKNLQEFQEYLKQRKIVIERLKDEDIITLYDERNSASVGKKLPDLIDEGEARDPLDAYVLECDYCPQVFTSRDFLEEHLKSHDFKLAFFCEDCCSEFPTNKGRRAHNITCLKKLVCRYCDFMLASKGKKRQHEQKHCDAMYGQLCDVCGEKFKHQGTLDQHVKTQHMSWEKRFQCPKCPKKFAFKQKLSFHLKSVHTTMRAFLCEDCGADFKNPASLRHHRIRKHQPNGNKRECQVCHKLVPFYSLSKHMYTHKAYTIQCPHCDKMFKNTSTLKQHVRIHEDQRQYRCDTCGVGFNRRDGLRLHMRVHQKTDSRALKECCCQICSEKFPNHSMLVIHRNRVHKDGKQYTCNICNRSMLSTRSLEWHMSHIHNQEPSGDAKDAADAGEKQRVLCTHCNKTFKTEMILRTHIKNTHMEKNPVKCPDCDLTFTSEVRLRHHMMVTHSRYEGTLTCPHCPKRFVNQLRLKTHMISHSEDRPFPCDKCGFHLKTKIQLLKHHQNRHSDERPLQCRYCSWRCKQVSALVCHERTHTNERPYSCMVCKQRFKYLGDKNKHERRHESLGGSGFKRHVTERVYKRRDAETGSDQDPLEDGEYETLDPQLTEEQYEQIQQFDEDGQIIKFETQDADEYEQVYEQEYDEQEYDETSREASEAADVIMSMEDGTVYTEEVTDQIETVEMITDEMLQSGTAVVHLRQKGEDGKIQVIPLMLTLPNLGDGTAVTIDTAPLMYSN